MWPTWCFLVFKWALLTLWMANLEYMKYGTNQSNKNRVVFKYLSDLLFEWDENVKKKRAWIPRSTLPRKAGWIFCLVKASSQSPGNIHGQTYIVKEWTRTYPTLTALTSIWFETRIDFNISGSFFIAIRLFFVLFKYVNWFWQNPLCCYHQ